ncbi:MAG: Hsp70 family protein [Proteobacteria bacterium]|nr:Hsp70 family protein [Pseudomonadota bacterium]
MVRKERFFGTRVNPNRVYHNTTFLEAALRVAQSKNFPDPGTIANRHDERLQRPQINDVDPVIDNSNKIQGVSPLQLEISNNRLAVSLGYERYVDRGSGLSESTEYIEVIPRGTKLPCEGKDIFETSEDNQSIIEQNIFLSYSSSNNLKDADYLGVIQIADIEPAPAGEKRFQTIFSVNEKGLLSIQTNQLGSEVLQSIEFNLSQPYKFDATVGRWRDREGRFTRAPEELKNRLSDGEFEAKMEAVETRDPPRKEDWMPLRETGLALNLNTSGALTLLIIIYGVAILGIAGALVYALIETGI